MSELEGLDPMPDDPRERRDVEEALASMKEQDALHAQESISPENHALISEYQVDQVGSGQQKQTYVDRKNEFAPIEVDDNDNPVIEARAQEFEDLRDIEDQEKEGMSKMQIVGQIGVDRMRGRVGEEFTKNYTEDAIQEEMQKVDEEWKKFRDKGEN